jgi:hypothetical protein
MADYFIEVSIPNVGPQGPQGEVGPVGPANELTLGEITTGDAGTEAVATISGTPPNQTLDLVLPRGDTGAQGNPGPAGAGGVGVVPAPIYATMQEAVEDGITFGGVFRHTGGSVYWVEEPDPDAATFIAASGATDVWNIQKFVQGVKDLGLWDDMVCWPLRSSQNAGTGTTAYSLGGLGTYNGTLVNGPTWGVDGITFDGTDDRIVNASLADNAQGTLFVTAYTDTLYTSLSEARIASFDGGMEIAATRVSANLGIEAFYLSSPFNGVARGVAAASPVLSRWFSAQAVFINSSGINRYIDGTDKQSVVFASTYTSKTNFSLGRRTGGNQLFWNGKISFGAYSTAALSDAQVAALHSLYKTTLGTGLGLP